MKERKSISRKKILLCLILAFSVGASGCGQEEPVEEIELHEPAQIAMGMETVRLRNLYDAYVYEATVYPYTEEYFFEESRTFKTYGAMVGETVRKGTPLAYADMDAVRERAEAEEETLQSLKEEYEEYCRETAEDIIGWEGDQKYAEEVLENLEEQKPEEFLPVQNEESGESSDTVVDGEGSNAVGDVSSDIVDASGPAIPEENGATNNAGTMITNPEYVKWQAEVKKWEGEAAIYGYYIDVAEEKLRQRTELYNLDYGYHDSLRKELQEEEQRGVLTSQMAGTVIAMNRYLPGDTVRKGSVVATVADLGRKMVKCPEISNVVAVLRKAQEIYAFFGGERYEILYEENGEEGYSSFSFAEEGEVSVGDYGAVVIVMESRTQVPTLSVEAIYTDGVRKYVYIQEEGRTVVREVEIGMSDGIYTEILSGINDGEQVLLAQIAEAGGGSTAVLERGSYGVSYSGSGTIYYPRKTLIRNPVENGTVIFQETLAAVNQYVEKGDVITVIRVEGDELKLLQLETDLKRARERLADLSAGGVEGKEDAIAQREERIAQMEEDIAVLQEDYAQTAICTTVSGMVDSRISPEEGTVIKPGETVARISDTRFGYLVLNTYLLNYGDMLEVTYSDRDGESHTVTGTVVTLGSLPRNGRNTAKEMLVAFSEGEIAKVEAAKETAGGLYSINHFSAKGLAKTMENVVMVPKEAVTVDNGYTYVNVVEEDGSVVPVSFLAGGANEDCYWVIEGLTEGMTICWE